MQPQTIYFIPMKKSENNTWMNSSLLLPGCMFIGMGVGMLFNAIHIGLFIGMGISFISIGTIKLIKGNESSQNSETN